MHGALVARLTRRLAARVRLSSTKSFALSVLDKSASSSSVTKPGGTNIGSGVVSTAAGVNSAITRALAPPHLPVVELPAEHAEELEELYEALMMPLQDVIPSQQERVDSLRRVDTSLENFFARRERIPENYAYLIRCLGVQGELARAHEVFDQLEGGAIAPDSNCFHALADACARSGDVAACEAAIARMEQVMQPTAPMFTGLIMAHRNAGNPAATWADAVLARMRELDVTEDAPTHTAIINAYVKENDPVGAWAVYDRMIADGVRADAVTFTTMMSACARGDQLEQAPQCRRLSDACP